MKNKIILLGLVTILCNNLFSQNDQNSNIKNTKNNFKFGLKLGYDMNPLTSDPKVIVEQLKTNGVQYGCFVKYGNIFYIQPEFYYTELSPIVNSIHLDYKIKGLQLPVMFGIKFLDIEILNLRVMSGPVLSSNLSNQEVSTKNFKINYNWQVGVGVDIFDFVTADLRYSLLKGIDISNQISDFNSTTNILNLTIGLKY